MSSEEPNERCEQPNELATNISTLMTEFKMLREEVQAMKEVQSGAAHCSFEATAGPKKGKAKKTTATSRSEESSSRKGASKTRLPKRT